MRIKDIMRESHERAKRKGFYENPPTVDQRIALIHSEVSEAYEEYRAGNMETYRLLTTSNHPDKPEGFPSECADIAIRLFDMCEYLGIDLEGEIRRKSDYNETRPHKHGKKF